MHWTRAALRAVILRTLEAHRSPGDADASPIDEATLLGADLGIDSLATMEVIAALEDALEIKIPIRGLVEVHSAGDVIQALEGHLRAAGRLS